MSIRAAQGLETSCYRKARRWGEGARGGRTLRYALVDRVNAQMYAATVVVSCCSEGKLLMGVKDWGSACVALVVSFRCRD